MAWESTQPWLTVVTIHMRHGGFRQRETNYPDNCDTCTARAYTLFEYVVEDRYYGAYCERCISNVLLRRLEVGKVKLA